MHARKSLAQRLCFYPLDQERPSQPACTVPHPLLTRESTEEGRLLDERIRATLGFSAELLPARSRTNSSDLALPAVTLEA